MYFILGYTDNDDGMIWRRGPVNDVKMNDNKFFFEMNEIEGTAINVAWLGCGCDSLYFLFTSYYDFN